MNKHPDWGSVFSAIYINIKDAKENGVNKSYTRKYVPANTFSSLDKGTKGYWQFSGSKQKTLSWQVCQNLCHFSSFVPYLTSNNVNFSLDITAVYSYPV